MKTLKKTIDFGKIAFYGKRKVNRVTVEVELRDGGKGPVFSACGNVWNAVGSDIVCGGQCLDEIAKFVRGPAFRKVFGWWKKYHCNDMHAGTPEQEKYLAEHRAGRRDYDGDCECLKEAGLYEVELGGKPYRYGEAWLYEPIPEEDLAEIRKFLEEDRA